MRGGKSSLRVTPSYDAGHNQRYYMYHTTDLITLVRKYRCGIDMGYEADAVQATVSALQAELEDKCQCVDVYAIITRAATCGLVHVDENQ